MNLLNIGICRAFSSIQTGNIATPLLTILLNYIFF